MEILISLCLRGTPLYFCTFAFSFFLLFCHLHIFFLPILFSLSLPVSLASALSAFSVLFHLFSSLVCLFYATAFIFLLSHQFFSRFFLSHSSLSISCLLLVFSYLHMHTCIPLISQGLLAEEVELRFHPRYQSFPFIFLPHVLLEEKYHLASGEVL